MPICLWLPLHGSDSFEHLGQRLPGLRLIKYLLCGLLGRSLSVTALNAPCTKLPLPLSCAFLCSCTQNFRFGRQNDVNGIRVNVEADLQKCFRERARLPWGTPAEQEGPFESQLIIRPTPADTREGVYRDASPGK